MHYALVINQPEAIKIGAIKALLQDKKKTVANITNSAGETILQAAFKMKDKGVMFKKLIEDAGVNINQKDAQGNTILHKVVQATPYDYEMIEYLLGKGANPHLQNNKNISPFLDVLAKATSKGLRTSPNETRVLKAFDKEYDPRVQELHFACAFGSRKHVRYLIAKDMDVNKVSYNFSGRNAPLHTASLFKSATIRQLFSVGADYYVTDDKGKIPKELISQPCRSEVITDFEKRVKAKREEVDRLRARALKEKSAVKPKVKKAVVIAKPAEKKVASKPNNSFGVGGRIPFGEKDKLVKDGLRDTKLVHGLENIKPNPKTSSGKTNKLKKPAVTQILATTGREMV